MALNTSRLRNPALKEFADDNLNNLAKCVYLGKPIVATANNIVTIANMKNGAYTIAAQPDVPRNITVTHATVAVGVDTVGTITIVGTDVFNNVITDIIIPAEADIQFGTKAFKTITSITGAGWVIAGGNDTITVGVGAALGLPFAISAVLDVVFGVVGTAIVQPIVTASSTQVANCTVSLAVGTYDGTKKVSVFTI